MSEIFRPIATVRGPSPFCCPLPHVPCRRRVRTTSAPRNLRIVVGPRVCRRSGLRRGATRAWRGRALHVDDYWRDWQRGLECDWRNRGKRWLLHRGRVEWDVSRHRDTTWCGLGICDRDDQWSRRSWRLRRARTFNRSSTVILPARRSCSRRVCTATRRLRPAPGTPSSARPAAAPG